MARFPGARWIKSPNYTEGHVDRAAVVIHVSQGDEAGGVSWLTNDRSGVSSTFFVARSGRVTQMVEDDDTAWTNGLYYSKGNWYNSRDKLVRPTWPLLRPGDSPNKRTVTIEFEGWSGQPFTAEQYTAGSAVLRWLGQRWPSLRPFEIGKTIIRHSDLDNVDKAFCPGDTMDLTRLVQGARDGDWRSRWEARGVKAPPPEQENFAIARVYRSTPGLGACLQYETWYGDWSVAIFENGLISYHRNGSVNVVTEDGRAWKSS